MKREDVFKSNEELKVFFDKINTVHNKLDDQFNAQFDRSLPFAEELFDRWSRAKKLEFGKNSSIYNASLVFGNPDVGRDVWIGPFTIIDGSGGLVIGDNVTVSSGVHIYTHDNVKQTLLGKHIDIERAPVEIGHNTYIGPNVVISMGVKIGEKSVVATNSFVNRSFPKNSIIAGNPAKKIGNVILDGEKVVFKYD